MINSIAEAADPEGTLSLGEIAENNDLMKYLLLFSNSHGVLWSRSFKQTDKGLQSSGVLSTGDWYYNKTNPLKATESIFTTQAINEAAENIRNSENWEATSSSYSEAMQNAIKSQYPELYQWLNMNPEQRATDEGKALLSKYEVKIKVSGLDDLAQLNEISSDIATSLKNIAEMDVGAGMAKEVKNIIDSITTTTSGINAYDAIVSGSKSDSDYAALAAYLNVDESYLRSLSPALIKKYYGNTVRNDTNRVQTYAANAYDNIPTEYKTMFASEMFENGIDFIEYKPFSINALGPVLGLEDNSQGTTATFRRGSNPEAKRARQKAQNQADYTTDARTALSTLYNIGIDSLDSLLTTGALKDTNLAKLLTVDDNYNTLLNNRDEQGLISLLSGYAYGTSGYNKYTDFGNSFGNTSVDYF